jgi:hypothetical protein
MKVVELSTGIKKAVVVRKAEDDDFKLLVKKRFSFAWKQFKHSAAIYKLQIEKEDSILGVVALTDWPAEKRMEIKLLASSSDNIGRQKMYEGIAGCLIAFTCRLAVAKYGPEACVSLVPKTRLIKHYMEKYYMKHAGWQLYLEGNELTKLVKEYL